MRTTDIIRRAGMNLRQAKARTILTSLAIGVGAFTIALALAAGNGGRNYTEQMVNTSGDMHSLSVYPKFEQEQTSDELPEYGATPADDAATASKGTMTAKDTALLKSVDGVESVRPLLSVDSSYMTRGEGYKKRVAALSVKDDRTEMKLAAGSLKDNMLGVGEVVIPEGFFHHSASKMPNRRLVKRSSSTLRSKRLMVRRVVSRTTSRIGSSQSIARAIPSCITKRRYECRPRIAKPCTNTSTAKMRVSSILAPPYS